MPGSSRYMVGERHGPVQGILQTGGKQPEAEALHRKIGYRQIPAYLPYQTAIPSSVCFEKELEV
jgi:hypothetical protein